jgi:hypothetical protein
MHGSIKYNFPSHGEKYNLVLSEKMVATLPATPETTVKKKAGMLV